MKGNGVAEELLVLQYGRWYPEYNTYVVPNSPFTWAWPNGKPKDAPFFGAMYTDDQINKGAATIVGIANTFSFKFGRCPASAKYCHHCPLTGKGSDMDFARMQAHFMGDMSNASNMGKLVGAMIPGLPDSLTSAITGAYTLEKIPENAFTPKRQRDTWKRTCYWGMAGCNCLEFGSYDLTKIMDSNGERIQPHHQDFLDYMGDVPIFMWAGFKDEKTRAAAAWFYETYR